MKTPRAPFAVIHQLAARAWTRYHAAELSLPTLYVLAVRGYYRDTMGKPGTNDLGIYDDAIFIVDIARGIFHPVAANTDPSRAGWNPKAGKFMARLAVGVYRFRRLKHHPNSPAGYLAYGQGPLPVTVERLRENLTVAETETGVFGINLHRGGASGGTSSEGCLTIPADLWPEFDSILSRSVAKSGLPTFPLILIDGPIV